MAFDLTTLAVAAASGALGGVMHQVGLSLKKPKPKRRARKAKPKVPANGE